MKVNIGVAVALVFAVTACTPPVWRVAAVAGTGNQIAVRGVGCLCCPRRGRGRCTWGMCARHESVWCEDLAGEGAVYPDRILACR
jgi:hypothetical protein